MSTSTAEPFYQCQRCGNCCRWPGDVLVDEGEIEAIAGFLSLPLDDFVARFTRLRANRQGLSLIEKPNEECVFLDGINCTIQAVKPHQCSGFPNTWNFPGWQKYCEAIPVAGPGHSETEIARPDPTSKPDQLPDK